MSRPSAAWLRPALVPGAAVVAGLSVAAGMAAARSDGPREVVAALSAAGAGLRSVPWVSVSLALVIPVLAVGHYLLAASALRAASGHRLPFPDTLRAQLAAAAANRLLPNGLGGTAVNLRYLLRSGQARVRALTAMTTLGLVGAATDAAVGGAVTVPGSPLHLPGSTQQLAAMAAHGLRAGRHLPWPTLLAVAVLAVAWLAARRRGKGEHHAPRELAAHVLGLLRSPRRLAVLGLSSAGTTAILALGFVTAVRAVAGHHHTPSVGALVVVYLVGGAVGGALPVPAFLGATEAALVGALVAGGVPFATALAATLLFRLVSFWAPVPLGVLAGRRLRQKALL